MPSKSPRSEIRWLMDLAYRTRGERVLHPRGAGARLVGAAQENSQQNYQGLKGGKSIVFASGLAAPSLSADWVQEHERYTFWIHAHSSWNVADDWVAVLKLGEACHSRCKVFAIALQAASLAKRNLLLGKDPQGDPGLH